MSAATALVVAASVWIGCAEPTTQGPVRTVEPTIPWSPETAQPAAESETLAPSTSEAFWRTKTGGEIWGGPTPTQDGQILVGSDDRFLYAVDSRDGSIRWSARVDAKIREAPRQVGEKALVLDESGELHAFDLGSGRSLWNQRLSSGSKPPWAVHPSRVVHMEGPALIARNPVSGGVQWRKKQPGTSGKGTSGKPGTSGFRALHLDAEKIYGIDQEGNVQGIDAESGRHRWTTELRLDTHSPPVSHGHHLLLVGNGFLFNLDTRTGQERWRALTHEFVSASPEITDGPRPSVLVAGGDTLFAFDLEQGHERWRRKLDGAFRSGPKALGHWALVGSGEHLLTAFDRRTGQELWRFETDAFITGALAADGHPIHGNRALFGGVDGALYGVLLPEPPADAPPTETQPEVRVGPTFFDGVPEIRWKRSLAEDPAPPVTAGDRLILAGPRKVTALAFDTGRPLWQEPAVHGDRPVQPAVSEPLDLVVTLDGRNLRALSLTDGRHKWLTAKSPGRPTLDPQGLTVFEDRLFVGNGDGSAVAFDLHTGERLWQKPLRAPIRGAPAVLGDKVFFGTTDGRLVALDAARGRELWRADTEAGLAAGPHPDGDTLYAADVGGTAYAFDPIVGGLKWTTPVGGSFRLPPATLFGTVFLCGDDGRLVALDGLSGVQTRALPIADRCTGAPQVYDGIVYVGSQDRSLHAANAVNGEELWRLHTSAPVVGSALGVGRDGRSLVVAVDRAGQVVAVGLP